MGPNGIDPSNVVFTLSFHADVKAGVKAPWSMPGQILWWTNFPPGSFRAVKEAVDIEEGWYDPPTSNHVYNADWTCWRYTFPVDPSMAFVQTGSVENAVTYWLDVQAAPQGMNPDVKFGWKTTPPEFQWNDDACWAPALEPYNGFWWDMHYPPGHAYHRGYTEEDSFDLAFMLFGGPLLEEDQFDFGDAPDPTYPTLFASSGASHRIVTGPWLGGPTDAPDPEPDGQPAPNALGDDLLDGNDDEGGVGFPQLIAGQTTSVSVMVGNAAGPGGVVELWIDWNGDGSWQHPAEQAYAGFLPVGPNMVGILTPAGATNGWTFARVRISSLGGLPPTGPAEDGEVEDYEVFVDVADLGDAPDGVLVAGYPTLLVNNGAWHVVNPAILLGAVIDDEPDGQPNALANGDDSSPPGAPDDEDGIVFTSSLYAGMLAGIQVTVVGSGNLSAWLDGNADGDWGDSGEKVLSDVPLSTGTTALTFSVPPGVGSTTFMRFRYCSNIGIGFQGGATDGEVEDYRVVIVEDPESVDYGDAPTAYPVVSAQNGARHAIAGMNYAMGTLIDAEPNGQPSAAADDDDTTVSDDEDGVLFPTNTVGQATLVQGSNMTVQVVTPGSPWLTAWIDYNGDGDWDDTGETVASAVALSVGTNNLAVTAPTSSNLGPTAARFRTSSLAALLAPTGAAPNGEVEDYLVTLYQPTPSPTTITFTNITLLANSNTLVRWTCDPALLTQPQACSNIVEASTNASAWISLTALGTAQDYTDTASGAITTRFYRVRAPYVVP